jgi:hypothetical protein
MITAAKITKKLTACDVCGKSIESGSEFIEVSLGGSRDRVHRACLAGWHDLSEAAESERDGR